jgi:hypothetical protein
MVRAEHVHPLSLKELVAAGREIDKAYAARECSLIEEMVKAYLFSRYEGRRKRALQILRRDILHQAEQVDVITEESNSIIYSYTRVNNNVPYFFVDKYRKDTVLFEIVPTEEERKKWKEH